MSRSVYTWACPLICPLDTYLCYLWYSLPSNRVLEPVQVIW
jgi:hypothetical protein